MNFNAHLKDDVSAEAKLLRETLEQAIQLVLEMPNQSDDYQAALIYLGNPHVAIPQRLLTHTVLDSHQKVIWALHRNAVQQPGAPAPAPKQSELAGQTGLTRQTVNEKIQLLRMRRWMTRCVHIRASNGKFSRLIWAIHDEPLALADTLYLDEGYLEFLENQTQNVRNRIRQIAGQLLTDIDEQVATTDLMTNPSPLARSTLSLIPNGRPHRVAQGDTIDKASTHRVGLSDTVGQGGHLTVSDNPTRLKNAPPQPDEELGRLKNKCVTQEQGGTPVGLSDSSSCSSSNIYLKNTTTTLSENPTPPLSDNPTPLKFPDGLAAQEVSFANFLVKSLPPDQRQFPLDYLRDRMRDSNQEPLTNKLAYLRRIVQLLRDDALEPSSYGFGPAKPSRPRSPPQDAGPEPDEVMRQWRNHMLSLGQDPDALLGKKRLN